MITVKKFALAAGLAAASILGAAAQASTITISTFDAGAFAAATAGGTIEDFENFTAKKWATGTQTKVGTFASLGGTGSGTVCKNNNDGVARCTGLALQIGSDTGQGNVIPTAGTKALSSNDTKGIVWDVFTASGSMFNKVIFALRDAADIKGTIFKVTADGATASLTNQKNDNRQMVMIDFGRSVSSATVQMISRVNDGFTIDGATVMPAPVPVPAAGFLLAGGLGLLGALRKRRKGVAA